MESFKPFLFHDRYRAEFGAILLEDFGLPLPGEALLRLLDDRVASAEYRRSSNPMSRPNILLAWIFIGDYAKLWVYRHLGMEVSRHRGFLQMARTHLSEHAVHTGSHYSGVRNG